MIDIGTFLKAFVETGHDFDTPPGRVPCGERLLFRPACFSIRLHMRSHRLHLLAGAILVVLAYSNFFHNAFHFDDSHVIESNPWIRSLANVPRFFTDAHTFSSLPSNATYRPLVTLSMALDYAVTHSLDPVPFHVTQLVLLLLVAGLLVPLFRRVMDEAAPSPDNAVLATLAATLFAVHTANTETMNFIASRSELLSAVGLLSALLLYVSSPAARRSLLYLLPLIAGALAKAPVVVFAGLVFAWIKLFGAPDRGEDRSAASAFRAALPSLITGVVLLAGLSRMNAPEWTSGGGSRFAYLITQPFVWLHYARLSILPLGLTADTDWKPFTEWYDSRAIVGYLFIAALVWLIVRTARREEWRPVSYGLAWFAITLFPTSSVFPLAEVTNEHRLFFPLMGLALAFVWTLRLLTARSRQPQRAVLVIGTTAAVLLATGTWIRNRDWRTEETLWRDVTIKAPGNGRAWMNYGLTQMAAGRYPLAKASFDRAEPLTPNYPTLEINQGIVEGALGHRASAEQHFQSALRLQPDATSHFFYARWLVNESRAPEAIPHLQTATKLNRSWFEPVDLLLLLERARNQDEDAARLARNVLAVDPGDQVARTSLDPRVCRTAEACFRAGLVETSGGRHLLAAQAYRRALAFNPRLADAWLNLGWSQAMLGFDAEAAGSFRHTLELRPGDARA